jgi:phosphoribosylanthranilate isomerase
MTRPVETITPAVKICCISTVAEARLALDAGAQLLGLVSAMPSGPGVIDDELIATIAASVPAPVQTVLLTAHTQADAIAEQYARLRTTTLQLVDHVPEAELLRLRRLCPGVRLIQVIHVQDETAVERALAISAGVDALLLDSGNPAAAVKELGGTGRTHDWAISRRLRDAVAPCPVYLAGGLHSGNVAAAVAAVRPHGLDVCSGVRRLGRLDECRLRAFIAAVCI